MYFDMFLKSLVLVVLIIFICNVTHRKRHYV